MDKQDRKKITDAYKARRALGGVFAVRNSANGKALVLAVTDLQGSKNRFEFAQQTGGCAFKPLQEDCNKYGPEVFSFEILEQLEQKEGQSDDSFKQDIEALYGMLTEGMDSEKLY
jgi:hypothetical protein